MASRFSSLSKSNTELLHKELRANYGSCSEIELDRLYHEFKSEHERLKVFLDLQRQDEDKRKDILNKLRVAQLEIKREERAAYSSMSTLQRLGSIFSTPKQLSVEHDDAKRKVSELHSQYMNLKNDRYSTEVAKRKKIYHVLKVLSELREEIKNKRVRSLANASIGKARSTSSSTKRKHISQTREVIACPYCECQFETVDMVLDHIYPIAKGGLDTRENTVLVCKQCNMRKSDKTLMVFCNQMRLDHSKVFDRLLKMGKGI
ncbi:MAG: HNH endonuclease [Rhodoferax sp.]|nr:HNH endonuclease [Rhodoferax sp.]MCF8208850.1 HNH endonuclease [Rhodoferax sp.]